MRIWLTGHVLVNDGDKPRLDANGNPVSLTTFFRASEAEIVDNWNTLGMRGTGSHDVRLNNVFVPTTRCFVLSALDRPSSAFSGPLYRFGLWIVPLTIATVCLGIARARALIEAGQHYVYGAAAGAWEYVQRPAYRNGPGDSFGSCRIVRRRSIVERCRPGARI